MKRILAVLSEWGYWAEEMTGPLYHFDKAGYQTDFMTPTGQRPQIVSVSMDANYVDPPLGTKVTSPENAQRAKELEDSGRMANPINLSSWFPLRPYLSEPDFLKKFSYYFNKRDEKWKDLEKYDCLLLVGGCGPIIDMVNNQRLHDVILGFVKMGKPVAAECYGVNCLVFARDFNERECIIKGKHVTGHPLEYDYKFNYGYVHPGMEKVDFSSIPVPYALEYILRDAVGPDGQFHGNFGKATSVVLDYPFITSRSVESSYLCGETIVKLLNAEGEELDDLRKNWRIC